MGLFLIYLGRVGCRVFAGLAIVVLLGSFLGRMSGEDRITRDIYGFSTTGIGISAPALIAVVFLSILSAACWLAARQSDRDA